MFRAIAILVLAAHLVGCRAYVYDKTWKYSEGNHQANYRQVFGQPVPSGVTVVHSAVVTSTRSSGYVETAHFQFELIVSGEWIENEAKRSNLRRRETTYRIVRRDDAPAWYVPRTADHYDIYLRERQDDPQGLGKARMLVDKDDESDGRRRVFLHCYPYSLKLTKP